MRGIYLVEKRPKNRDFMSRIKMWVLCSVIWHEFIQPKSDFKKPNDHWYILPCLELFFFASFFSAVNCSARAWTSWNRRSAQLAMHRLYKNDLSNRLSKNFDAFFVRSEKIACTVGPDFAKQNQHRHGASATSVRWICNRGFVQWKSLCLMNKMHIVIALKTYQTEPHCEAIPVYTHIGHWQKIR